MARPKLTVKDNGFKRLMALGKELKGRPHVKVGFLAATAARVSVDGKSSDLSNPELAVILHYGGMHGHLPPRPFMTNALKRRRRGWRLALGKIGKAYLSGGGGLSDRLAELGAKVAAHVRTEMRRMNVPDAESTLREKRGSQPLLDSRQLLQAVTFQVMTHG